VIHLDDDHEGPIRLGVIIPHRPSALFAFIRPYTYRRACVFFKIITFNANPKAKTRFFPRHYKIFKLYVNSSLNASWLRYANRIRFPCAKYFFRSHRFRPVARAALCPRGRPLKTILYYPIIPQTVRLFFFFFLTNFLSSNHTMYVRYKSL
jgi:hypothetical protein